MDPDGLPDAPGGERGELPRPVLAGVPRQAARTWHSWMAVELDSPRADRWDQAEQVFLRDPAGRKQAVDALGEPDPGRRQPPLPVPAKEAKDGAREDLRGGAGAVQGEGREELLGGKPDLGDPEFPCKAPEHSEDYRVKVHVVVPVHVRERQPGVSEPLELRADLAEELAPRRRRELVAKSREHGPSAESAEGVHEIRDLPRRKGGETIHDDQVEPDRQARPGPSQLHRLRGGLAGDHQARSGQDAPVVRLGDPAVDGLRRSEVIPGDRERPQEARASRRERNRKNSTPSRRRRFVISTLVSISATISAILRGRK